MSEFGINEEIENILNNSLQAQEVISIRTNHNVCLPVKSLEPFEEYNNWVSACTMLSCPVILLLKAKEEVKTVQFLEFKLDTDNWSSSQINQVQRAALVVNLRIAMKKMEVGALLEKEWLYIEKREKENEWKKQFKGKDKTCIKVLKRVVRKRMREHEQDEELE